LAVVTLFIASIILSKVYKATASVFPPA
jgi:hypothetical protein